MVLAGRRLPPGTPSRTASRRKHGLLAIEQGASATAVAAFRSSSPIESRRRPTPERRPPTPRRSEASSQRCGRAGAQPRVRCGRTSDPSTPRCVELRRDVLNIIVTQGLILWVSVGFWCINGEIYNRDPYMGDPECPEPPPATRKARLECCEVTADAPEPASGCALSILRARREVYHESGATAGYALLLYRR